MDHASFHDSPSTSTRIRISSGMASAGCVSLSWMATFSGNRSNTEAAGRVEHLIALLVAPDDVLDGGGDEEVLLGQAQLAAGQAVVARVQHAADVLGPRPGLDRADVIALVELVQVELADRPRAPEAQRVDRPGAVAGDRRVVGRGAHVARVDPLERDLPVRLRARLHAAVELDAEERAGPRDLPGVAVAQPAVGDLHLRAVDDPLVEDAVVVAEAVAVRGIAEGGQRIEQAGGEPAQTAIAEPGV